MLIVAVGETTARRVFDVEEAAQAIKRAADPHHLSGDLYVLVAPGKQMRFAGTEQARDERRQPSNPLRRSRSWNRVMCSRSRRSRDPFCASSATKRS